MALLMVFLKNAFMCAKKVKLINHDCLPILMLLYIMLYIMLAHMTQYIVLAFLMLFAALYNAVFLHTAFLFHVLICILHSAFNLLVFPNSMFTPLLFF